MIQIRVGERIIMTKKEESVYLQLRNDILQEGYKEGDHLAEMPLAEKYGASRLHVKAALAQLAQEHLVEHFPERGFFVLGLTEEGIREINQLRKALTALIVESCIDDLTEENIGELRRRAQRIMAFVVSGLTDETTNEVTKFYRTLQSYSPYKRVAGILETYNDYIQYILRHSVQTQKDHEKGAAYISSLVDALEKKDLDLARAVIEKQDDYKA